MTKSDLATAAAPLQSPTDRPERRATQIAFLITGLAVAVWAPLVPFAKQRLGIADDGELGLLLLCMGIGSMAAMPFTGFLTARLGCRRVILASVTVLACTLPVLALSDSTATMALALGLFGGSIGTLDVAMNLQAVIVERSSGHPLMSGFHALYSVGGILGAAGVSGFMALGVAGPVTVVLVVDAVMLMLVFGSAGGLLPRGDGGTGARSSRGAVPVKGIVLLIGAMCFVCYLAEGAMLDWSALFLSSVRNATPAFAGLGYAVFSAAMTAARLAGDRVRTYLGDPRVILFGGLLTVLGFLSTVVLPSAGTTLLGLMVIGLGVANIVPVLFSAVGRVRSVQAGPAISAITAMGYAGVLAGPAMIGFVARAAGLQMSFCLLAGLVAVVACCFRVAPGR